MRQGIVYKISCLTCADQNQDVAYIGESSRTPFDRGGEWLDSINRRVPEEGGNAGEVEREGQVEEGGEGRGKVNKSLTETVTLTPTETLTFTHPHTHAQSLAYLKHNDKPQPKSSQVKRKLVFQSDTCTDEPKSILPGPQLSTLKITRQNSPPSPVSQDKNVESRKVMGGGKNYMGKNIRDKNRTVGLPRVPLDAPESHLAPQTILDKNHEFGSILGDSVDKNDEGKNVMGGGKSHEGKNNEGKNRTPFRTFGNESLHPLPETKKNVKPSTVQVLKRPKRGAKKAPQVTSPVLNLFSAGSLDCPWTPLEATWLPGPSWTRTLSLGALRGTLLEKRV